MIFFAIVALSTMVLVTATCVGVWALERAYPPAGELIEVEGGRINVVDIGPRDAEGPPLVLLHGASSNLRAMRLPLGDRLARRHRVILLDRPGHGWSRGDRENATLAGQGRMIELALRRMGLPPVILVAHSLAGALAVRMTLDHPERVAGLVLLAPVTHPWEGGVGIYNKAVTIPVIGRLLAHAITLPLGLLLASAGARSVFRPQPMPENFLRDTAALLLLRPREFLANARDLVGLKSAVREQVPRYRDIRTPVVVITGDADNTVSPEIHARAFAATVPDARLIVLPGVGHMVQYAATERVAREIEKMISKPAGAIAPATAK